eukprot:1142672-Pelagomonas_calceolata.AAC.5
MPPSAHHIKPYTLHRTCSWMRPNPWIAMMSCMASPTAASDATKPSSAVLSEPSGYSKKTWRGAALGLLSTLVSMWRSTPTQ